MKQVKPFTFTIHGNVPNILQSYIDTYNGKPATKDAILNLDSDITFIVCNLNICHGNLNKIGREAWLCPENNADGWNVIIKF